MAACWMLVGTFAVACFAMVYNPFLRAFNFEWLWLIGSGPCGRCLFLFASDSLRLFFYLLRLYACRILMSSDLCMNIGNSRKVIEYPSSVLTYILVRRILEMTVYVKRIGRIKET